LIRCCGEAELFEAGLHRQSQDGGVDLGRWREGFGREGEELFHAGVELRGNGEESVVARAGLGGDAVRDFALNHDDGAVEDPVRGEEVEENIGCDVVGEIADYEKSGRAENPIAEWAAMRRKPLGSAGRVGDGLRWRRKCRSFDIHVYAGECMRLKFGCERGEVGSEDILVQDGDVGLRGEVRPEVRGEGRVEFDGDEALGAAGEDVRDGSAAGADFDDGAVGDIAECVGDGGLSGRTDEKVLAEFRAISESHCSSLNLFKPPLSDGRDGRRLQILCRASLPKTPGSLGRARHLY
jgi:hypothetical protein